MKVTGTVDLGRTGCANLTCTGGTKRILLVRLDCGVNMALCARCAQLMQTGVVPEATSAPDNAVPVDAPWFEVGDLVYDVKTLEEGYVALAPVDGKEVRVDWAGEPPSDLVTADRLRHIVGEAGVVVYAVRDGEGGHPNGQVLLADDIDLAADLVTLLVRGQRKPVKAYNVRPLRDRQGPGLRPDPGTIVRHVGCPSYGVLVRLAEDVPSADPLVYVRWSELGQDMTGLLGFPVNLSELRPVE